MRKEYDTSKQLEQLSGSNKQSVNTMSTEKNQRDYVDEGNGLSTKRPQ